MVSKSKFIKSFSIGAIVKFSKNKFDLLNVKSAYYLRIMTKDLAGVLSKITSFFENYNMELDENAYQSFNNSSSIINNNFKVFYGINVVFFYTFIRMC